MRYFFSRFIIYTKIFQWVNFNSKYKFINDIFKYLKSFCSDAPYIDSDIDYNSINYLKSLNFFINEKPINSGTIALVFEAYKDNKKYAIKILRNNIENKAKNALKNIDMLTNFVSYFTVFNFKKYIDDVKIKLLDQLNFDKEIKNINLIKHKLRNYKLSNQPKAYEEYCTDKVIVMDFIEGKSLFEIKEEEKTKFIESYMKLNFAINFKYNLMHLDLHPGNILYSIKDNRYIITYLDMGLFQVLTCRESNLVNYLCKVIYLNYPIDVLLFYIRDNLEFLTDDNNINNYNKLYEKVIQKTHLFKNKNPLYLIDSVTEFLMDINSSNVLLKPSFSSMFLASVSTLSTLIELSSDSSFEKILEKEIEELNGI